LQEAIEEEEEQQQQQGSSFKAASEGSTHGTKLLPFARQRCFWIFHNTMNAFFSGMRISCPRLSSSSSSLSSFCLFFFLWVCVH
jgi:hypothetical protein